jgi:hypothetical protein
MCSHDHCRIPKFQRAENGSARDCFGPFPSILLGFPGKTPQVEKKPRRTAAGGDCSTRSIFSTTYVPDQKISYYGIITDPEPGGVGSEESSDEIDGCRPAHPQIG